MSENTRFYQGGTVRIHDTIKDFGGSLTDPDSMTVEIYDPDGAQVTGSPFSPTKELTGVWYYDWKIPIDAKLGIYTAVLKPVKSDYTFPKVISFEVKSPID